MHRPTCAQFSSLSPSLYMTCIMHRHTRTCICHMHSDLCTHAPRHQRQCAHAACHMQTQRATHTATMLWDKGSKIMQTRVRARARKRAHTPTHTHTHVWDLHHPPADEGKILLLEVKRDTAQRDAAHRAAAVAARRARAARWSWCRVLFGLARTRPLGRC